MMRHKVKIYRWLMTLLCCVPVYCTAQQSPVIHYTMSEGLPSNTVYDAYRDRNGFMWFSTDKGLARYNGISFETFTIADGLPDDEVFYCREDGLGRLWIFCYSGKLCFYQN